MMPAQMTSKIRDRDGERGIVIVVALLVLLALAGLGLVAAHRVNTEINLGRNYRDFLQAQNAGQVCQGVVVQLLEKSGDQIFQPMLANNEQRRTLSNDQVSALLGTMASIPLAPGGISLSDVELEVELEIISTADSGAAGFSTDVGQELRVAVTTASYYYPPTLTGAQRVRRNAIPIRYRGNASVILTNI